MKTLLTLGLLFSAPVTLAAEFNELTSPFGMLKKLKEEQVPKGWFFEREPEKREKLDIPRSVFDQADILNYHLFYPGTSLRVNCNSKFNEIHFEAPEGVLPLKNCCQLIIDDALLSYDFEGVGRARIDGLAAESMLEAIEYAYPGELAFNFSNKEEFLTVVCDKTKTTCDITIEKAFVEDFDQTRLLESIFETLRDLPVTRSYKEFRFVAGYSSTEEQPIEKLVKAANRSSRHIDIDPWGYIYETSNEEKVKFSLTPKKQSWSREIDGNYFNPHIRDGKLSLLPPGMPDKVFLYLSDGTKVRGTRVELNKVRTGPSKYVALSRSMLGQSVFVLEITPNGDDLDFEGRYYRMKPKRPTVTTLESFGRLWPARGPGGR